jgi:hypothetical protein
MAASESRPNQRHAVDSGESLRSHINTSGHGLSDAGPCAR